MDIPSAHTLDWDDRIPGSEDWRTMLRFNVFLTIPVPPCLRIFSGYSDRSVLLATLNNC